MPHSHDDVGWLVSIETYYDTLVKRIYTSVVEALSANPARKFISVEMAYFSMWLEDATELELEQAARLIQNGQLQFIVGGWTMEVAATILPFQKK